MQKGVCAPALCGTLFRPSQAIKGRPAACDIRHHELVADEVNEGGDGGPGVGVSYGGAGFQYEAGRVGRPGENACGGQLGYAQAWRDRAFGWGCHAGPGGADADFIGENDRRFVGIAVEQDKAGYLRDIAAGVVGQSGRRGASLAEGRSRWVDPHLRNIVIGRSRVECVAGHDKNRVIRREYVRGKCEESCRTGAFVQPKVETARR